MKHLSAINYREVPFGFEYGSAKITRLCSEDKKGWIVIGLETLKYKENDLQIYVTKTGKVRISDSRGEWTPPAKK